MDFLLPLSVALVALGALGIGVHEFAEYRTRMAAWQTVALQFGRDVTPESVLNVATRLSGLHRAVLVVLEVRASARGIEHHLSSDKATLDTLRGSLRALLPSLRVDPVDSETTPAPAYRFGRSLRLSGRLRTIHTDSIEQASNGLLSALQPLGRSEHVLIRWVVRSGHAVSVPREEGRRKLTSEERQLLAVKNQGGVLRVRGFVAAHASTGKRASHLLGRVSAVLRTRSTPHGQVRSRPRSGPGLRRLLARRFFLISDRYGAAELAGLLAWPIEAPQLPGISLGTSPQLIPSARLPRKGRVLGTSTWPGMDRPIAQPVVGALSHSLIAGPTGVGKSTLLTNLLVADIAAGRGLVLIDGKGDTAAALLERVPESRENDVVVLDCASGGPLPGIELFGGGALDLAADIVLGVLSDLFRDSWGPLSERYLRAGLVAVAGDPAGTLADVPYVYSDPAYRREMVGRLRDPLVQSVFAAYEGMSAAERQQQLAAPLNKLQTLLGRPVVRTVLGQPDPKLDFRVVLAQRRIVVVSLAPARVGGPASRLIGALVIFTLFQAVQARSSLPPAARQPFLVAIDEPKALGELHMPLDALLEQARGLGVGVTLAPQSISQLPKGVREAALTNAATRVVFRQTADDARLLARDLPGVEAEQLGDLAAFEAIARVGLGPGDVAAPVSLRTSPLGPVNSDREALIRASSKQYGRPLAEVDAALQARHQPTTSTAPVGRKRRRS